MAWQISVVCLGVVTLCISMTNSRGENFCTYESGIVVECVCFGGDIYIKYQNKPIIDVHMNPWATDCCNITYKDSDPPHIRIIDNIGCISEGCMENKCVYMKEPSTTRSTRNPTTVTTASIPTETTTVTSPTGPLDTDSSETTGTFIITKVSEPATFNVSPTSQLSTYLSKTTGTHKVSDPTTATISPSEAFSTDTSETIGLLVWGGISTLVIICIIGIAIVRKVIMVHKDKSGTVDFPFRPLPVSTTRSQSMPLLSVSMQAVEEIGCSPISHRKRSHHQFI